MAYNLKLADRIRAYLIKVPKLEIEEKKMFGGLAFMVNDKMCINVSGESLMCRFDPVLQEEIAGRNGFQPMIMKGKEYKGFCYVSPNGFKSDQELKSWIDLCLDFNERAKSSENKNN